MMKFQIVCFIELYCIFMTRFVFFYRKTIEEAGFEEIKVKFYRLMVEYYSHEVDCWEVCQCFFKVRQRGCLDGKEWGHVVCERGSKILDEL